MSEYWKSTPKYWCKHCKTFVRDTKLEKTNHEATPKHQGNIKRFLRDLHRGHEKDEREKQRAKDEVERLNGVVGAPSTPASGEAPWRRRSAIPSFNNGPRQATPAERKAQLAQLAAMGVAVPEDFRREMAMAGDWQTLSETPIYEGAKKEEDTKDTKSSIGVGNVSVINIGVRKRKFEGQEEEEEAGEQVVRKGWGSKIKRYPGADRDLNLDALLNNTKTRSSAGAPLEDDKDDATPSLSRRPSESTQPLSDKEPSTPFATVPIKREDSGPNELPASVDPLVDGEDVKHEEEEPAAGVVFKKRKAKPIRQK